MRELVDSDNASLPTALTSSDASQQSKIASRGNSGTPPPRKTWDLSEEQKCSESHASKQKCHRSRSQCVVRVLHPIHRKNEGKNPGGHLKMSQRRRIFAQKRRRGKRAVRKAARMKHMVARAGSRLNELTFGTFNVRTAAVSGVNGIGPIDTPMKPCAAKSCDAIGLQEIKRHGTSEIVTSGYRVYFSVHCSGDKGRKGQHGVGLVIKEEIVQKAGKDGIAIGCISARLLKGRVSTESNFVTFVLAYASTEEAPEGQKVKYMAAFNSTVASVTTREYFFVLTDANARTDKKYEGGGESDSKMLGAYS